MMTIILLSKLNQSQIIQRVMRAESVVWVAVCILAFPYFFRQLEPFILQSCYENSL